MKGPGDFTPDDDDDRVSVRAEELEGIIAGDRAQLLLCDAEASLDMTEDDRMRLLTALADLDGVHPADLPGSDVLTTLYRLAKDMAGLRDLAVTIEARDRAERESADWPVWRGTIEATRRAAQREQAAIDRWEDRQ